MEMMNELQSKLTDRLCVSYKDENYLSDARSLAEHLKVELVDHDQWMKEKKTPLLLIYEENGLHLTDGSLSMCGDLSNMIPRVRQSNMQQEMLVKAARIKGVEEELIAVDATAGMGEDSVLLAAAGFQVYLFEYDPVIAALLSDSLRRALDLPELREIVCHMHLTEGSSIEGMKHLDFLPDVILLDPMFPARQKSALVKKKFQLLHHLEQPCSDEKELLEAAIQAKPRKIVIKRPTKGPYLAGIKPSHSYSGKAIRYDCLVYAR